MKIEEFKKNLYEQQSVMVSLCSTNDNVLTVSYEVSELIAKKHKPYDDGAWANELLVKAAKKLAPKSVYSYQNLSLSRPTVCKRIKEIDQDIENNLKKRAEKFVNFSLCLDETTDIKNTVRDVEAVIFQTLPLPLPHLSLPLPLPPTKNEKTTVDNFFKLLWVCSLPSPTLYHFEKTKTFIYCYYFTYFA